MKKIVLGCAAVLLSLGLLAGCNNDTDSAVTISVDNTATVVVGETLELPYTVEPEKAKVEALSDHEEYVTANAKDGVLTLDGVAAGSATITLVGTYKKYTEANVDIKVSVVTEGEADQGPGPETGGDGDTGTTTYKLGSLDEDNYTYRWFTGSASTNFLASSTSWDEGADIYITGIEDDGIDSSCTLSFYDENEALKYISWSSSTNVDIKDDPYTWVWVDSIGCFAQASSEGRVLVQYTDGTFRAYAQTTSNLAYPHVAAYTEKPADPEIPTPTVKLEQVASLTNGETYYLGGDDETLYHLINGSFSNNRFSTTTTFDDAVAVVATGDNENGWTLTIDDQYVYAYISGTYNNFGLSTEETVPDSGTKTFLWNETYATLYTTEVHQTGYSGSYFEYYNNLVSLWGYSGDELENAAHFYQVVEE